MVETYGMDIIKELLLAKSQSKGSWTKPELTAVIEEYASKLAVEFSVVLDLPPLPGPTDRR
jgi:hypothetical protein